MEEISVFEGVQGKGLCDAKRLLADRATALIHGESILASIHQSVDQAFSSGRSSLSEESCTHWPSYVMTTEAINKGLLLMDILVALGFVSSRSQARQKIREGAVKISERMINDELYRFDHDIFCRDSLISLSLGRKKKALLKQEKKALDGGDS